MIEAISHNFDYRIQKAVVFEGQNKYLHAYQIYNLLLEEFPEENEVYIKMAGLLEKMKNLEEAIAVLNTGIDIVKYSDGIRLYLGHLLFKNQKWEETISTLSKIKIEEEPLVAFFKGYSFYMLKEFESSVNCFLSYIRLGVDSPFVPDAYIYLTKMSINMGKYDSAINYLKQTESVYSGNYEQHLLFAIIYYHKGMETYSIKAIEKALKLNNTDKTLLEWAGNIYLKTANYNKIENLYFNYLEKNVATADIFANLGLACFHSGKISEAEIYLESALRVNSTNQKAVIALRSLKAKKGEGFVSNV